MVSSTSSGLNFGWRCYEGSSVYDLTDCPAMNTLMYEHPLTAKHITGLKVSILGY